MLSRDIVLILFLSVTVIVLFVSAIRQKHRIAKRRAEPHVFPEFPPPKGKPKEEVKQDG